MSKQKIMIGLALIVLASLALLPPIRARMGTLLAPERPRTATPAPASALPTSGPPLLPAAEPGEQAGATWLYLSAWELPRVGVLNPATGRALHEIPAEGQLIGVAVAPDGGQLYVLDGPSQGRLRVIETGSWRVLHEEPVPDRAMLLGGNALALSGDGRWLVVPRYSYERQAGWTTLFDLAALRFVPETPAALPACHEAPRLLGLPGHERLYATCEGTVVALDAQLAQRWRAEALGATAFALSPDGATLYGLITPHEGAAAELQLALWETVSGKRRIVDLTSALGPIPPSTIGRGGAGYLALSPDGGRLYIAWEDRLWAVDTASFAVLGQLALPSPVDGLQPSVDGRELYLLPSTAGDLHVSRRGLLTVDAQRLALLRQAAGWPESLGMPRMVAAPAAPR